MLVFMLEDWRGSLRDVQGRTVSEELMQSLRKPELFKGQLVVAICSVLAPGVKGGHWVRAATVQCSFGCELQVSRT
jgi:hypothetical protein